MNLLLLLALAIPLSCLALLVSLALLGVLTLGGVIRLAAEVQRSNIVPTQRPRAKELTPTLKQHQFFGSSWFN